MAKAATCKFLMKRQAMAKLHSEKGYHTLCVLANAVNSGAVYKRLAEAVCEATRLVVNNFGYGPLVEVSASSFVKTYFKENVAKADKSSFLKLGTDLHKIVIGGKLVADYILGKQDLALARTLDKMKFPMANLTWQHKAAYVGLHEAAHASVYLLGKREPGISHGEHFYCELKKLLEKSWDESALYVNSSLFWIGKLYQ